MPNSSSTIRYKSELLRAGRDPDALLEIPRSSAPKLSKEVVEGTINAFPFRAALESNGRVTYLTVNKALQDAIHAGVGDRVTVEITRIGKEPEIRIPEDLKQAFTAAPQAQAMWARITPMARRDWILWISSAKQEETRHIRIKKACDMLASGKRRVCCFGGLNWLTKDHPKCDTWLPLPRAKK